MVWVDVSALEAKAHALYGVRGWLLVFAAWYMSPVVLNTIDAYLGAVESGHSMHRYWQTVTLMKPALVLQAIGSVFLLVLLATKSRIFRPAAICVVVATALAWAVAATTLSVQWGLPLSADHIIGPVFFLVAWSLYLGRSVRVRVTFEHKVPSGQLENRT